MRFMVVGKATPESDKEVALPAHHLASAKVFHQVERLLRV